MKVWIRKRKNNKTLAQFTLELPQKDAAGVHDWNEPIGEACHALNLARPIIMDKHINELLVFNHTVFRPDDFIERVDFDRLEVELF